MNEKTYNEYLNQLYSLDTNRFALLQSLANTFGDFKATHSIVKKNGDKQFSKWRTIVELSESGYTPKLSHRQILPFEIVLDVDEPDKLKQTTKLFRGLCSSLKCDLFMFETGSKGYHIHIFAINDYIKKKKNIYNNFLDSLEIIIKRYAKYYDLDTLKISRNVLIALEFAPHWKSQKQKKIILGRGLFYEKYRYI